MTAATEGARFASRRHRVALERRDGAPVVRKTYADAEAARRERSAYERLVPLGIRVPVPLGWETPTGDDRDGGPPDLVLPYVDGPTALDLLEAQEAGAPDAPRDLSPWRALAAWCAEFHQRSGLALGDPNLRNFLRETSTGRWFGIDFEDCAAGDAADDFGALLAFVVTYDPARTPWKQAVAAAMREAYAERTGVSAECLLARQADGERALAERRRLRAAQDGPLPLAN